MMDQADQLIAALCAAQREGNPVPGGDPQTWGRIIRVAAKRWNSFTRRHPSPAADTLPARVEDLARGLLVRCASRPGTGAPIELTDCRDLARRLARVLGAPAATASTGARVWGTR
jgi:hypothetical protein